MNNLLEKFKEETQTERLRERRESFGDHRLFALTLKEFKQTIRNKHLLFLLLFPPLVQLLIIAASLDPDLKNLPITITDLDKTETSRELKTSLENNTHFVVEKEERTVDETGKRVEEGKAAAAVVIPENFSKDLKAGKSPKVQIFMDGVDAYSARVASGNLKESIMKFKGDFKEDKDLPITIEPKTLYNPNLIASWYFIPGLIGSIVTLVGTLVSSAVILRERDLGTMEQLLMTPSSVWEIVLAKIIPIFVLLMTDIVLGVFLSQMIFGLPFRGNPITFLLGSAIYVCVCIGTGILLGTLCKSQRQAQLSSFFINIPLIVLSGSVVPFESMPAFLQALSSLDPLRYYTLLSKGILLKGAGIIDLWPNFLVLIVYAAIILFASVNRFRRQLA